LAVAGTVYVTSGYVSLAVWARAEKECEIDFKVGGIKGPYGDSLKEAGVV